MVSTETGILVPGTTARFRFTPPAVKSFIKKAKASENCTVKSHILLKQIRRKN
jgi:hypothetical protein